MNELIKFLTSTEVVIVYIVAGSLIALCLLIYESLIFKSTID